MYPPDDMVSSIVIHGSFFSIIFTFWTSIGRATISNSFHFRAKSYALFHSIWIAEYFGGIWVVWDSMNSCNSSIEWSIRLLRSHWIGSFLMSRSNEGVKMLISTVKIYRLIWFSRREISFVLSSVATKIHPLASGSSVPVCHIFLIQVSFRSFLMRSKLVYPRGLLMR